MTLAKLLYEHPSELRADFQQYYGLNIDGMGVDYSVSHAADLAAMLPHDSRSFVAERPDLEWTNTEWLLWSIEYSLRVLRWQPTKDGQADRNRPKPLPTPADRARIQAKVDATDMDYIAEQLGLNLGGEDG